MKVRIVDVAAVTVGAVIGLVGATTTLIWAAGHLVRWSGRRRECRMLGGRR